jgi:hypothetical protein
VRSIEISGKVESVSGSCPAIVFEIKNRTVFTTSRTEFDDGRCRDVRKGTKVKIKGMLMSDGKVRADEIEVDGDDD